MWDKITQRKLIESKRIHYSWFTVYISSSNFCVHIVIVACHPNYSNYVKYACSTENACSSEEAGEIYSIRLSTEHINIYSSSIHHRVNDSTSHPVARDY